MNEQVKIVACPRDAWQDLPKLIPAEVKAAYLRDLIAAGFRHVDAVSFLSSQAAPQAADSEQVLRLLQPPSEVEIIGVVADKKGAERAITTEAVNTLGFPYSISPGFLRRYQNQTPEEALDALDDVAELAYRAGLDLVVYVSMAFGNPYGDYWSLDEVIEAYSLLTELGVEQISLADTVGLASPEQIAELVSAVIPTVPTKDRVEFGVHLHARQGQVEANVLAAYNAGCRRFDTAIGGLGGPLFARNLAQDPPQDRTTGNIPTEQALDALRKAGAALPQMAPLAGLLVRAGQLSEQFGPVIQ
ncbi:MAG: hydroxymethylglutaryl-CoA lyase [Acidobacteriaceae bacterium]